METLVFALLIFLLATFGIAAKNKSEPKAKQDNDDSNEYDIDDLMETLDFLLAHQIITPTQYNNYIVRASQFL